MGNTVIKVMGEVETINRLMNIIESKTRSENGVYDPTREVVTDVATLRSINSRLFDLRDFYLRSPVDIPFDVREE